MAGYRIRVASCGARGGENRHGAKRLAQKARAGRPIFEAERIFVELMELIG